MSKPSPFEVVAQKIKEEFPQIKDKLEQWRYREKEEERFGQRGELKVEGRITVIQPFWAYHKTAEEMAPSKRIVEKFCKNQIGSGFCKIYKWCPYGYGIQTPAPNRLDRRNCEYYEPP